MNQQRPHSSFSARRVMMPLLAPLAIALAIIIGWETMATAATANPADHVVAHNGKCPGDKDDDCKN